MIRLRFAMALVLAAGCGLIVPATETDPTARELCADGGSTNATIDGYFELVESGQAGGLTKMEIMDDSADACIAECEDDTQCAQVCIVCLFAIVDEVY